jgi:hypothetical protein
LIALGAILTYPSDIPNSLKHKVNGMLVATSTVVAMNLIINLVQPLPIAFFYPFSFSCFPVIDGFGADGELMVIFGITCHLPWHCTFAHRYGMLQYSTPLLSGGLFTYSYLLFFYIRPCVIFGF